MSWSCSDRHESASAPAAVGDPGATTDAHHDADLTPRSGRDQRVANDEPELLALLTRVLALAGDGLVTWAVDMTGGEPALLIALLLGRGQELLYLRGRMVNRAADGYRGEGKTDARDALVIADQARMRRDLRPVRPGDEAAVELELLTGRRADLVEGRTRTGNRLRGMLTGLFPPVGAGAGCDQPRAGWRC